MLHSIIAGALRHRLILVVVALALLAFGFDAAQRLSVDAFPDVTNIQVQIATEAPGKSPEEVERFVTIPIEIAMTGLPGMTDMRSLNKPGLSLITLVFSDDSDVYRELFSKHSGMRPFLTGFSETARVIFIYKGTVYKLVPQ